MIEEIISDKFFDSEKFSQDFFIKGVYCFFDDRLESLTKNDNWIKGTDGKNFEHLIDQDACKKFEQIIIEHVSMFSELEIKQTKIFSGIDDLAKDWHTDSYEKMFLQALCYQVDFNSNDGGKIRVKCLDDVERYFIPKNGSTLIMNHYSKPLEHKVDEITSIQRRTVICGIFNLKT